MRIRQIIYEDFVNYKKVSMFIGTCFCNWKCCHEANIPESICQNYELHNSQIIELHDETLIEQYIENRYSDAIVFGGLEPFLQFNEIVDFIKIFRNRYNRKDDIVIYTGFTEDELQDEIDKLKEFDNIIIKFGRFLPDFESHFDEILGVNLISPNQYAKKIS